MIEKRSKKTRQMKQNIVKEVEIRKHHQKCRWRRGGTSKRDDKKWEDSVRKLDLQKHRMLSEVLQRRYQQAMSVNIERQKNGKFVTSSIEGMMKFAYLEPSLERRNVGRIKNCCWSGTVRLHFAYFTIDESSVNQRVYEWLSVIIN